MIKIRREPEVLFSVLISPVIFVLLFAFVFGSAIEIVGGNYREFVISGAFVMTITFGATFTGVGLASDMQKGIVDRFRSLPMSRSAVVFGRTASDVVYNLLSLVVMSVVGVAVGWRIHGGLANAIAAFALLLLFAYAISWAMAYVGLAVRKVEVVSNASNMVLFPLTFRANTFVPSERLPVPLRQFAEWNPVSAVTQAARELFGNFPPGAPPPSAWPLQNATLYTIMWIVLLVAVFSPLAIRRFTRQ